MQVGPLGYLASCDVPPGLRDHLPLLGITSVDEFAYCVATDSALLPEAIGAIGHIRANATF